MDKIDLGRNLQNHRRQKDLTQEKLAEAAEMSTIFLSEIETGKSQPGLDTFLRLSAELNVRPKLLLDASAKAQATSRFEKLVGVQFEALTDQEVHAISVLFNAYISLIEKRCALLDVGRQIRKYREKKGLTKKQLGIAVSKSGAFIGRIESSKNGLSLDTLIDIATALETPIEYLLLFPRASEEFVIEDLLQQNYAQVTDADEKILKAIANSVINNGD